MSRSIGQQSADCRVLVARIASLSILEVRATEDLAASVQRDPESTSFRSLLRSACRIALRDHKIHTQWVGNGVQRITDQDASRLRHEEACRRVGSACYKAEKTIRVAIESGNLNSDQLAISKARHQLLGITRAINNAKVNKRAVAALANTNGGNELPTMLMLDKLKEVC